MNVTIKDIAKALGISIATVSRAMSNSPEIKTETRERVLEMARKMNYKPNIWARNLQNRQNNLIGVVVPEFITFFFPEIIMGIQEVLNPLGYQVLICSSCESSETERKNVCMLEKNMVDGMIVSVSHESKNRDLFERLLNEHIPLVFVNRVFEDLPSARIVIDDHKWAYKAVELLIKAGYRKIAHLAGNEHLSVTKGRIQGYIDALTDYGIPYDPRLLMHVGVQQQVAKVGLRYLLSLKVKPDAIFAVNDPVAIGVYLELKERGIRVPDDMGLVGFSDSPTGKVLGLSSVEQPTFEMGRKAAEMLLWQIQHKEINTETLVLDAKLNIRKSSMRQHH